MRDATDDTSNGNFDGAAAALNGAPEKCPFSTIIIRRQLRCLRKTALSSINYQRDARFTATVQFIPPG